MILDSGEINKVVDRFEKHNLIKDGKLVANRKQIISTTAGGSLIRCTLENQNSKTVECSLKLIPHQLFRRKEGSSLSTNRFFTALERWSSINHPEIARLFSFGVINRMTGKISPIDNAHKLTVSPKYLIYLLMEWVPGISLAEWLENQRGVVNFRDILSILGSVGRGLSASHQADLAHLDIKTNNIIVKEKDGAVSGASIIDWELAHPDAVTQTGGTGTTFYYAPELLAHKHTDFKADLFSLSIVALELLIGYHPFKEQMINPHQYVGFLFNYTPKMLGEMIGHFELNWKLPKTISQAERNFIQSDYPRMIRSHLLSFLAKEPEERPLSLVNQKDSANWMIENIGGIPHQFMLRSLLSYRLEDRLKAFQAKLTAAAKQLTQKDAKIRQYHIKLEEFQKHLSLVQAKLASAGKELFQKSKDIQKYHNELEENQHHLTLVQDKLASTDKELLKKNNEIRRCHKKLEKERRQLTLLKSELYSLKSESESSGSQLIEKNTIIKSLSDELKKSESSYQKSQKEWAKEWTEEVEKNQVLVTDFVANQQSLDEKKLQLGELIDHQKKLKEQNKQLSTELNQTTARLTTKKPYKKILIYVAVLLIIAVGLGFLAGWLLNKTKEQGSSHTLKIILPENQLDSLEKQTGPQKDKSIEYNLEEWALIKPGSFKMGSSDNEPDRDSDEGPIHEVTISKPFLLKKTEVTQGEWHSLMGNNPSHFSDCGDDCPVEKVNWLESLVYCNALSWSEGLEECYNFSDCQGSVGSGCAYGEWYCIGDYRCSSINFKGLNCKGYRLPTEAEWEYAARAESVEMYYAKNLGGIAWYYDDSNNKSHPVGLKSPNAWGLYDVSGNVWEWTWDWYNENYYAHSPEEDPLGAKTGDRRVLRGGSWFSSARNCRLTNRSNYDLRDRRIGVGFRVARSFEP